METEIPTRIIVSTVLEHDGMLLFGRKKPDVGPYPNTWHLIGGGINPGEPLEDAIRREILEEAGTQVSELTPVFFGDDQEPNKKGILTNYIYMVYHTLIDHTVVKPGDDIVALSWFARESLSSLTLSLPTKKVFRRMGYLHEIS